MKRWCHWLRRDSAASEAATLLSGNVLAQGVSMLAYLVLMRLFSPEDYSLFNIFYSYIEVLVILSTCKYELAVVSARDGAEATAVARFALRLNAVVSLVLLGVVTLLYFSSSLPGSYAELGAVALMVPPMVWLLGSSRVYAGLFNRVRHYRVMAASALTNASAGSGLKILFGVLGMGGMGLPLGTVLGQGVANLVYGLHMRSLHLPSTSREERLAAARCHRNYPFFVASKDLLNSLSANLPFLWLAFYFDRAEVGLFGLALTLTFRPVNFLSTAFESVLYARTAERVRRRERIMPTLVRFLLVVNAVALPVGVVAWLLAEPVLVFLFGAQWEGCGVYVRALLPWMYMVLSSTSLMFIPNIFSTQGKEFLFYVVMLFLRVVALAMGIASGSFLLAIRLYSGVSAVMALVLLGWYLWQARRYERLPQ